MGEIAFDVTTPATAAALPIFEQLVLSDGSTALGQVNFALTVVPAMEAPQSGDSGDQYDQEITGGCSAGGSSGLGGLAIALGLVLRRRRR